jgi:hypothetical protein
VYSSAPTPPAFSSVPSRSHSTRRSDTRHSPHTRSYTSS